MGINGQSSSKGMAKRKCSTASVVIRILAVLSFAFQIVQMILGEGFVSVGAFLLLVVWSLIDFAFFAKDKDNAITFWALFGIVIGAFISVWLIFFPSWGTSYNYVYYTITIAIVLFLWKRNMKENSKIELQREQGTFGAATGQDSSIVSEVLRIRIALAAVVGIVSSGMKVSYQNNFQKFPYLFNYEQEIDMAPLGSLVASIFCFMLIDLAFFAKNKDNAIICWTLIGIGGGIALALWCYISSSITGCIMCAAESAVMTVVFIVWCRKIGREEKNAQIFALRQ